VRRPGWLQGPGWLRQSWLRQSRLLARARTRRGTWTRRSFLVVVLIGAAVVPGRAGSAPRTCAVARHAVGGHAVTGHCPRSAGTIRWTHRLPGSWIAENGALGTVLSGGEAYAGVGSGVVAVGFGETVMAYRLSDGRALWTASLASVSLPGASLAGASLAGASAGGAGLPAGSAVESVRAWPGVITAGVAVPAAVAGGAVSRVEVVLSAATGQVIRSYPAAPYGGAVHAAAARTVIVGTTTVTAYDNATGRVAWQVQTGPVAQAWRVSGGDLFVTVAAGGYLGAGPVTALRRIDLQTGQQSLVRDRDQPFAGSLSYAMDGMVLFSGPAGVTAYSAADGQLLWQQSGVVPAGTDALRQVLYVSGGGALTGLDPLTGRQVTSATLGPAGLYAVSDDVALGLDEGALGDAWGYSLATKRVTWTARSVPWPHFFVDLSGLGGSADPAGSTVVLAACARLGPSGPGSAPRSCLHPELVAVGP
jgi:hypothetical protein